MSQHEEAILNEQVAAQQRVITEAEEAAGVATVPVVRVDDRIRLRAGEELPNGHRPLQLREIQTALREQLKCATCGKTRVVLNLANYRRPHSIESITPETHCACPPRFTEDGGRVAEGPAWELVTDPCPNEECDHGEIVEMFDGYPETSICGICDGLGRVPKASALPQERAS